MKFFDDVVIPLAAFGTLIGSLLLILATALFWPACAVAVIYILGVAAGAW